MADNQNTKGKFNPEMGPKKGPNSKKPFNFYWIYGIIGVILISINLFSFSGLKKTQLNNFAEMIHNNDVAKIVVVNKEIVEITIKNDKLSDPKYSALKTKTFGGNSGPHFYLEFGSDEQFINYFNEFQKDLAPEEKIIPEYEKRQNWGGEIFGWLLRFGCIALHRHWW